MGALSVLIELQIKTAECIDCGCVIGMTAEYYNNRLRDHKNFWCPSGHQQHFVGESEVEKARRLLRDEEERHARTLARMNEAERQKREAEAKTTRLQKRIKAGVCPCCQRSVRQLALHIKSKHPDFKP